MKFRSAIAKVLTLTLSLSLTLGSLRWRAAPVTVISYCDFQTFYLYNVLKLFKLVLPHNYGVSDIVLT